MKKNIMTNDLSKPWHEYEYVVVDLEGTGPQHRDREGIVEIAAVLISKGRVEIDYFYRMLNPEISIPERISRIHGITNDDVQDKPTLSTVEGSLLEFLDSRVFVAHHASTEMRVLNHRLPKFRPLLVLDTLKMSRVLYPNAPKHGLDALIDRFDIAIEDAAEGRFRRHSAYFDATATAQAFLYMIVDKFDSSCNLAEIASVCDLSNKIYGAGRQQELF